MRSPASSPRRGGATGHAAILARSLGIPAVSGVRGLMREVHTGDLIALDGREGHVYLNPGPEVEAAYRKLQREYVDLRDRLIENRDQEPVSADGIAVELLANVNGPADAAMAARGRGRRRRPVPHGIPVPDPPVGARRGGAAGAYRAVIEAAPQPHGDDPHPRPGRRQAGAVPGPRRARPTRSWACAASGSAPPIRSSSRRSCGPSCGRRCPARSACCSR